MTLISFPHSLKYILLQMLPYFLLTGAAAYMATALDIRWLLAYTIIAGITFWRYLSIASTLFLFTHDMLIVTRGVLFRDVECRALWQLKGMQVRRNPLLRFIGVSHVFCGLQGPPADRIRIVGIADGTLLKVLDQLSDGVEGNLAMWREHFGQQAS